MRMRRLAAIAVLAISAITIACGDDDDDNGEPQDNGGTPPATATRASVDTPSSTSPTESTPGADVTPVAMMLNSTGFSEGERLPDEFTCAGANVSPPLAWEGAPAEAQAYALIMDDPDTPRGTFDHWVMYDIPVDTDGIGQAQAADEIGATPGANGTGGPTYLGACPPPGDGDHRYIFRIYALDAALGLPPGADKQTVLDAMEGHILGQGQLIGMYSRD